MEINNEIYNVEQELYNYSINSQRRRYLEDKLDNLNNGGKVSKMKSFEQFCKDNPWEPECRIYDL